MIVIWSQPQITIKLTHPRIITSCDCINLNFYFRGTKCRVRVNNKREAVVVCMSHVVKRPSKQSALVTKKEKL